MYTKVHPIGYKTQKTFKSKRTQCRGAYCRRIQTINLGNGQIKNIYHTIPSVIKGRTLGDMVYENFKEEVDDNN